MRLLSMTIPAVLTFLFTASTLVQAQRPSLPHAGTPQPSDPRTFDPTYESKMTVFLAKKDLLITQTHYPVQAFETGKGQRLRVEGVVASSVANRTVLKAVRLSPAATSAGSAQVDLDEVDGSVRGRQHPEPATRNSQPHALLAHPLDIGVDHG